MACRQGLA